MPRLLLAALPLALVAHAHAEALRIQASHTLPVARPSETITIPWAKVNDAIPHAIIQKLSVRDAKGRELAYQVTNVAPLAKDPEKVGSSYGDLIFQYDFAEGETSATFTVSRTETVTPPFPSKVFARQVPERLDDFAWENDRVAHRMYGPALAAPAAPGSGKEVLVTSGIDVWAKRVPYLIVDRWYNKGHDHYHTDQGEGMDLYGVGPSRGCGGTGIWTGNELYPAGNYKTAKVLANGPVRAIFELSYDTWSADGVFVSETKRFTVDAGRNLDRIESTFTATGKTPELVVAVGLNKTPSDKGQEPVVKPTQDAKDGVLAQWITQKTNGSLGTAIVVVDTAAFAGFAEDARNQLALAKVVPGKTFTYLAGASWDRAGHHKTEAEWLAYVAFEAARARNPLTLTTAAQP